MNKLFILDALDGLIIPMFIIFTIISLLTASVLIYTLIKSKNKILRIIILGIGVVATVWGLDFLNKNDSEYLLGVPVFIAGLTTSLIAVWLLLSKGKD